MANRDGSGLFPVTNATDQIFDASISPDSRSIVFADSGITIVDVDRGPSSTRRHEQRSDAFLVAGRLEDPLHRMAGERRRSRHRDGECRRHRSHVPARRIRLRSAVLPGRLEDHLQRPDLGRQPRAALLRRLRPGQRGRHADEPDQRRPVQTEQRAELLSRRQQDRVQRRGRACQSTHCRHLHDEGRRVAEDASDGRPRVRQGGSGHPTAQFSSRGPKTAAASSR